MLYRVVPPWLNYSSAWVNFSPLAAIVLCGAVFFPKRLALWVPLSILLVSDVLLNGLVYHFPLFTWDILPRYVIFGGIGLLAARHREFFQRKQGALLGASVIASLFFYLATNSASWLGDPGYLKTWGGWWQAMTVGLPGYPPTLYFFRNTLIGDLVFTGLFLVCLSVSHRKLTAPVAAAAH